MVNSMHTVTFGGSWLYCSRNMHKGMQSYKNDFESLAFLIIRYIKGSLPWSKDCIELHNIDRDDAISRRNSIASILEKKTEAVKQIRSFDLPKPYQTFVEMCFSLDSFNVPDYNHLTDILNEVKNK